MLSANQFEFLKDLDGLMKKYHIEKFEMHNVGMGMPYVAFYSNGSYLGISDYYDGEFNDIRAYQPSYKITGGEVRDDT